MYWIVLGVIVAAAVALVVGLYVRIRAHDLESVTSADLGMMDEL